MKYVEELQVHNKDLFCLLESANALTPNLVEKPTTETWSITKYDETTEEVQVNAGNMYTITYGSGIDDFVFTNKSTTILHGDTFRTAVYSPSLYMLSGTLRVSITSKTGETASYSFLSGLVSWMIEVDIPNVCGNVKISYY